ncbi:tRNA lysidine(34) synthetase TilS [uncultured Salinicola sp.]|uniref:tRNA lysidine(34) synthetase TilS n=1 Tax=uncultured Salinicola sp. TaxID=1193542 RepID=UPI0026056C2F|nr:tRNA lysidine(34) synthetase TilS [uncultured Salinicola sp.]
MTLQRFVDDALAGHVPGCVVWVALSGGLDSSLLLHMVAPLARRRGIALRAIHVNHGLQAAAGDFELHCRALCQALAVPLSVAHVEVEPAGRGLEAAAREARYRAFAETLSAGDRLWLAQHADDQAETFLLAALRGSGVRGLAGMPATRQWRGLRIERPWLALPRSDLAQEARQRGIAWCEDPSNHHLRHDRNFLRHRVVPRLAERWPRAADAVGRSVAHLQEADELLGELAEIDLARAGGDPERLPLTTLRTLRPSRLRLLVRHALQRQGLPAPPAKRLTELERQVSVAGGDRLPAIAWAGGEARIWRHHLFLMAPLAAIDLDWQRFWDGQGPLETPWGRHSWELRSSSHDAARPMLRVGLRRGGETMRLAGRGARDIKRLFQEAGIPPWQRDRLPLVWQGGELVAVLGVLTAEGWRQTALPTRPMEDARFEDDA